MFNGMLKSDDVDVYEPQHGSGQEGIFLTENCKSNIVCFLNGGRIDLSLPVNAYIGKVINITVSRGQLGTGKPSIGNYSCYIKHSETIIYTLIQGTVSFMYVGQQLNGLTATDKAKSGWVILGGVQGDTAITGYAGSVAIGSGAYCGAISGTAVGQNANATNSGTAIGTSSSVVGQSGVSIGDNAYSSGDNGIAIGRFSANANAAYGISIGYYAYSTASKITLKSNNRFSINGDAQAGKFILMRQTTDATPLVMSATNAVASTSNILILPNTSAYSFTGQVVARDASTGDCAKWNIDALIRRGANASTTALVGTPTVTKVFNDAGAVAWTIALTADTTNGGGTITVTGEAGKTIRWVSNIDSAEVI